MNFTMLNNIENIKFIIIITLLILGKIEIDDPVYGARPEIGKKAEKKEVQKEILAFD